VIKLLQGEKSLEGERSQKRWDQSNQEREWKKGGDRPGRTVSRKGGRSHEEKSKKGVRG